MKQIHSPIKMSFNIFIIYTIGMKRLEGTKLLEECDDSANGNRATN